MRLPFSATEIDARRVLVFLVVLEVLLVILFLADKWIPEPNYISESWFNLDGEENVPAIFSATQLFTVGLALFCVGFAVSRDSELSPAIIYFLGAGFVFLAIDEGFQIHETIQLSYRQLNRSGKMWEFSLMVPRIKKHYGVWLSIYFFFGTLMFLALYRPLKRFWCAFPTPTLFMRLGFAVFLAGAAGMEIIAYIFFWGVPDDRYFGEQLAPILKELQQVLEEGLEMLGISLVLYGVLLIKPDQADVNSIEEKSMDKYLSDKRIAFATLAVGVIVALLSILIDPLRGHDIHLANIQIFGLIVGIVAAFIGAYLAFMYKPVTPPEA